MSTKTKKQVVTEEQAQRVREIIESKRNIGAAAGIHTVTQVWIDGLGLVSSRSAWFEDRYYARSQAITWLADPRMHGGLAHVYFDGLLVKDPNRI